MYMGQRASAQHPALAPACLFFTLLPLYYFSWQYTTLKHSKHAETLEQPVHAPVWSDEWVEEWLDTHLIEPFDPWPLRAYCNKSVWYENLVFNLDNANGGIGNIRGNTLDFILYAIEAGASIMLPGRATRDTENYSNVWGGRADFDTFFDEEWFISAMSETCPQMQIYKQQPDQTMVDPLPEKFVPQSRRTDEGADRTKASYIKEVSEWLNKQEGYKADEVVVVNLERTLWEYDTWTLPPGVRRTVGQILRINPKVRLLAARAIQQLAMSSFVLIDPTSAVPKQAFMGAHLRTESDAVNAGWLDAPNTNFSAQTDAYIKQALEHKFDTIYVASGNATDLQRFKEKAALQHINVTSKHDLLIHPQDIEDMEALTWDQQALIDYEILQRCSVFGGFVRSSFSYNIALTRNQWLEDQGRVNDPWRVRHSEGVITFDDGLSRIIGRDPYHDAKIPRGMWP